MKQKIIIANWKLFGSMQLLNTLLKSLVASFNQYRSKLVIMPPYVYLYPAKTIISNTNISLGAQNVDIHLTGAFTGEISVNMLKDIGIQYVLVGHSERRQHHQECDSIVAQKFKIVKNANLIPILCIGETKDDYLAFKTEEVCKNQINSILDLLGKNAFNNSIIAYEPRWAIGSNTIPPISFIQKTLSFIQNYIFEKQNSNTKLFCIQYGGAVNEKNIIKLCKCNIIDGFLIGSASISLNNFTKILKNV